MLKFFQVPGTPLSRATARGYLGWHHRLPLSCRSPSPRSEKACTQPKSRIWHIAASWKICVASIVRSLTASKTARSCGACRGRGPSLCDIVRSSRSLTFQTLALEGTKVSTIPVDNLLCSAACTLSRGVDGAYSTHLISGSRFLVLECRFHARRNRWI